MNKLTDIVVRKAKPEAKPYKLTDGGGMYLLVNPNASRYWQMAYRFDGKQKTMQLGVYPEVTLKEARSKRALARKTLSEGNDPVQTRRDEKRQRILTSENTFELIARAFHMLKKPIWTEHHAVDWINTLEREVFPKFGHKPVTEIEAPEILDILRALESRGTFEVRARVAQRIRSVFSYAIATGSARHNPAAEIGREALAPRPKVRHFPALHTDEMPGFLQALADYQTKAKTSPIVFSATRLLMLTFTRTGEVRGARWDEFDFKRYLWTIPAERMKSRQPHVVPLSKQAVKIIEELRPLTGHTELLFPNRNRDGKVISENTVNKVIANIGYKERMCGHGFRSVASTYLNNLGTIRPDVIEAQLAHADKNSVRAAYNRADYMEYRKAMMQFWADTLDAMQEGKNLPKWAIYEPHGLDYRAAQVVQMRA